VKISLLTIGGFKSAELERLVAHYLKLAGKFAQAEHVELAIARNLPEKQAQDQALLKWLERRGPRVFLAILDERGRSFTSREFATRLEKIIGGSHTDLAIAVGGAHGYGDELKARAQLLLSLSPLTMAHELAAAVAAEQVFRALAILNNHPYHND